MRSMVEGYGRLLRTSKVRIRRGCPSTTLRVVPLPRGGRNSQRHDFRQHLLMKLRSRFERTLRQRLYADHSHHRRSRWSVMPIFSSASESASLTILTVTASTRVSCTNSVSQT